MTLSCPLQPDSRNLAQTRRQPPAQHCSRELLPARRTQVACFQEGDPKTVPGAGSTTVRSRLPLFKFVGVPRPVLRTRAEEETEAAAALEEGGGCRRTGTWTLSSGRVPTAPRTWPSAGTTSPARFEEGRGIEEGASPRKEFESRRQREGCHEESQLKAGRDGATRSRGDSSR